MRPQIKTLQPPYASPIKVPNSKKFSNAGRAGAVLAATVLSLGSTGADAAQGGAFVATAQSLAPVSAEVGVTATTPVKPIVITRVVKVKAPQVPAAPVQQQAYQPVASSSGGGGCGLGTIKQRESGGNYRAQNPNSTASGAYQVLNGTWGGYGGYRRAGDAPASVQDKFAKSLYAKYGSRPWVVC